MADVASLEHVPPQPRGAHFASLEQQSAAAHLGMWVFLASEALLFAGAFALYAGYRVTFPAGFAEGIEHGSKSLGSLNTAILLTSSYLVAVAVLRVRAGRRRDALLLTLTTCALGLVFLGIKGTEYAMHFHEGIFPGGSGGFYQRHHTAGLEPFFTLYFATTGLHALHVTVGIGLLLWMCLRLRRGELDPPYDHPFALGAMYWHLIDVVWIVVWPLYYLTGRI